MSRPEPNQAAAVPRPPGSAGWRLPTAPGPVQPAPPPQSQHAACRDHPGLAWDTTAAAGPQVEAAKAVCRTCPVQQRCLAYALADPALVGIWGGATTTERRQYRQPSAAAADSPARRSRTRTRGQLRRLGQPDAAARPEGNTIAMPDRPRAVPAGPAAAPPGPGGRPESPSPVPAARSEPAPGAGPRTNETAVQRAAASEPAGAPAPAAAAGETAGAAVAPAADRGSRMQASRAVTAYLDLIAGTPPKSRKSTRTVESELAKIDSRLAAPGLSSARRLRLLQDKRDLQTRGLPGQQASPEDMLRDNFIAHAGTYSQAHGISYEAFLDFGVPAGILAEAGLHPAGQETGANAAADGGTAPAEPAG
jgi:WhiB family transcriptional regulator, redox-sensing transcriptional regulator